MNDKKRFSPTSRNFFASPAFLVLLVAGLLAASIYFWQTQLTVRREHLVENTAARARAFVSETAFRFHTLYHTLEHLAAESSRSDLVGDGGWLKTAATYLEIFDSLLAIALVNESGQLGQIVPADDYRAYLGQPAESLASQAPMVSVWLPVYDDEARVGSLLALVNLEYLIAPIIQEVEQDYVLGLSEGGDVLYERGPWGASQERFVASQPIILEDTANLTLTLAPGDAKQQALYAEARQYLWFGLAFTVVIVTTAYFAQQSARRFFNTRLRYQGLLKRSKDAIFITDLEGSFLEANPAALNLVGYTRDEFFHLKVPDLVADPSFGMSKFMDCLDWSGTGWEVLRHKDGHTVTVEFTLSPLASKGKPKLVLGIARDISERKRLEKQVELRLELLEMAPHSTIEQVLQKTIDEVCALTDSQVGFLHFVDADQRTLSLQAWSTRTREEFCQAEGVGQHYPVEQAGVWVDCIREGKPVVHNDYASLPHRKGLPEGHAEVIRELVVPVFREGKVAAVLGVGNKPHDYTQADVARVDYLADVCWEVIDRMRMAVKQDQQHNLLEAMFNHLPMIVFLLDEEWRVHRASHYGADFSGQGPGDLRFLRCGEALRCLNALDDPRGCGFGPNCQVCSLRTTVLETIHGGTSHHGVEATLPIDRHGGQEAHFLLSSTPLSLYGSPKALVSLMDVTDRTRAVARTRGLLKQQTTLNQLTMDIALKRDPQALFQTLFRQIGALVDLDAFSIYAYDSQVERAARVFCAKNDTVVDDQAEQPLDFKQDPESCLYKVIRSGEPHYNPGTPDADHTHTCLCAPMLAMGDVVGLLRLESRQENAYSQETQDLVAVMASIAGAALQNARLIHTLEATVAQRTAELEDKVHKLDRGQKAMLYMVEDLNQTGAALKVEQHKLNQANQELEAFSYSAAHDLRAPLRYINGYIDLLTRRFPDSLPEQGRHYLDIIVDSAREMGVLIDSLLLFSKTSRREMHVTRVDMKDLVEETLINLRPDYAERAIEWMIGPLPHVLGDRYLLKLVWVNLLSNAIKFTGKRAQARVEVGCQEGAHEWQFFARDNGVGFDMKYAPKLFDVFQRLHPASAFEGIGIGLANLRRIIQRHGGRTWAEGEPGQGATFYFSLPK